VITFEWIASIVISAAFTLIGLLYKNQNRQIETESKERLAVNKALWAEINAIKKDASVLAAVLSNLKNIEKRLEELPSHKAIYELLSARDEKIEAKLNVIMQQDNKFEAIFKLLTKDQK